MLRAVRDGREFSLRQRKLSQPQRMALVCTPQVLLQGRDFRQWGARAFDDAVADKGGLDVQVKASLAAPVELESRVSAGENRGRTLKHDYVVLEGEGPGVETRLDVRADTVSTLTPNYAFPAKAPFFL